MLYSLLAGQPMTFVGPTGLTLAFMVALHQFCGAFALPFIGMYSWVRGVRCAPVYGQAQTCLGSPRSITFDHFQLAPN
eukprot:1539087-Prorocentrum_lima.AAC.1